MMAREDGMGFGENFPRLSLGLKKGHHSISHDKSKGHWEDWGSYDAWLASQFAYFVKKMGETRDEHGPLLDNTMVLYGSACSSTHNARNYPLVLAGGEKMGLKHGGYHVFEEKETPMSNLFVSMLNAADVPTTKLRRQHREAAGDLLLERQCCSAGFNLRTCSSRKTLAPTLSPQIRSKSLTNITKLNPNLWERGLGGEGITSRVIRLLIKSIEALVDSVYLTKCSLAYRLVDLGSRQILLNHSINKPRNNQELVSELETHITTSKHQVTIGVGRPEHGCVSEISRNVSLRIRDVRNTQHSIANSETRPM